MAWRAADRALGNRIGIGIEGLPAEASWLEPGNVHLLGCSDSALGTVWVRELIRAALHVGPVFVVAEHSSEIEGLLVEPALSRAAASRRLLLWETTARLTLGVQRHGIGVFFRDLRRAGLRQRHTVFVLGSRDVLATAEHTEAWLRWSSGGPSPVVLADRCPHASGSAAGGAPAAWHPRLRHASLEGTQGHPVLVLEVWLDRGEPYEPRRYALALDDVRMRLRHDSNRGPAASTRPRQTAARIGVVAMAGAVAGERAVPPSWVLVDGLSDVENIVAGATVDTVLLQGGGNAGFNNLSRAVHRLRLLYPDTLRIVVREGPEKLRSNCERALLHVGANAVVYREVGFSRLLQRLQDQTGETWLPSREPQADAALSGFLPPAVQGYLEPSRFCELVTGLMASAQASGVQHTLVRLPIRPHVAHLDAIAACAVRRDGDIFTADRHALCVFLFSCAAPDVDLVLGQLFRVSVSELFGSQAADTTSDGIARALTQLRQAVRDGLPDYSLYRDPVLPADAKPQPQHRKLGRSLESAETAGGTP